MNQHHAHRAAQKEMAMVTRSEFRFGLLFFLAAIVPPSIWVPQELCYWLDGYRPLNAAESEEAMGAGYCYGMYCSQIPTGCPTLAGPVVAASCGGKPGWLCLSGLFGCDVCTAALGTTYKRCRPSAFPDSRCNTNAGVPTPCGSRATSPCAWLPPTGPCFCGALPVPLPPGLPPCPISDCQ